MPRRPPVHRGVRAEGCAGAGRGPLCRDNMRALPLAIPLPSEAGPACGGLRPQGGLLQLYYGVCGCRVRSQGQTILVDTGMGPGPHPQLGNRTGNLYEELRPVLIPADRSANTNVSPSDEVDIVVHTHLHGDHVGWNLRYSGGMPAPNFRCARYLVPKLDWEHFTQPEVLEAHPYIKTQVIPLQNLRKMELIEGEHNVTDEISTLPAPATPRGTRRY